MENLVTISIHVIYNVYSINFTGYAMVADVELRSTSRYHYGTLVCVNFLHININTDLLSLNSTNLISTVNITVIHSSCQNYLSWYQANFAALWADWKGSSNGSPETQFSSGSLNRLKTVLGLIWHLVAKIRSCLISLSARASLNNNVSSRSDVSLDRPSLDRSRTCPVYRNRS